MPKKKEIKQIFENLDVESTEAQPQKSDPAVEDTQQVSTSNAEQTEDQAANLRAEMLAAEQSETPEQDGGEASAIAGGEQAEDEAENLRAEMLAADQPEQAADESMASTPPADQKAEQPGLPHGDQQAAGAEEESSDDILDDVRKSLLEEEAREEEHPKWWKRIGRSSGKKEAAEAARQPEEINMPPLAAMAAVDAQTDAQQENETGEYQEQLDELIDLLDTEEEDASEKDVVLYQEGAPAITETEPEPEKPADIEELKKQAFQSRPEDANESLTEVRSIALEGDEEVFVEVESKKQAPLEERLDAVDNALKPYQRYISFGLAFVGLVLAIAAVFLIYNVYQRSVARNAAATAVVESNLPYPTSVQLPGGWSFNLGKGALQEGQWNPKGAEWLQGTEVCRWVALPWSRQLEAVVRTLNPKDPIELGMSNNDKLTYNVYSIQQMSPEEMRQLDSNKPCLLIVLAEPDAQKRWVLTSLP